MSKIKLIFSTDELQELSSALDKVSTSLTEKISKKDISVSLSHLTYLLLQDEAVFNAIEDCIFETSFFDPLSGGIEGKLLKILFNTDALETKDKNLLLTLFKKILTLKSKNPFSQEMIDQAFSDTGMLIAAQDLPSTGSNGFRRLPQVSNANDSGLLRALIAADTELDSEDSPILIECAIAHLSFDTAKVLYNHDHSNVDDEQHSDLIRALVKGNPLKIESMSLTEKKSLRISIASLLATLEKDDNQHEIRNLIFDCSLREIEAIQETKQMLEYRLLFVSAYLDRHPSFSSKLLADAVGFHDLALCHFLLDPSREPQATYKTEEIEDLLMELTNEAASFPYNYNAEIIADCKGFLSARKNLSGPNKTKNKLPLRAAYSYFCVGQNFQWPFSTEKPSEPQKYDYLSTDNNRIYKESTNKLEHWNHGELRLSKSLDSPILVANKIWTCQVMIIKQESTIFMLHSSRPAINRGQDLNGRILHGDELPYTWLSTRLEKDVPTQVLVCNSFDDDDKKSFFKATGLQAANTRVQTIAPRAVWDTKNATLNYSYLKNHCLAYDVAKDQLWFTYSTTETLESLQYDNVFSSASFGTEKEPDSSYSYNNTDEKNVVLVDKKPSVETESELKASPPPTSCGPSDNSSLGLESPAMIFTAAKEGASTASGQVKNLN
jgi:hypothetical protein